MSASDKFENHLYAAIRRAIETIPDPDAADVYALSFWVYADDDDPRRQVVSFGFNTRSHAERSERDASDTDEAKWNFAFWLQNELALPGGEDDAITEERRSAWLDERGLNYTDEDEDSDFDRCLELAERIDDEFWRMCARVGMRLHESGVISSKFGRPIPIIVHNLEYDDRVAEITRNANPDAVAEDFTQWVDRLAQ